jgi:putative zinc finger protein
MSRRGDARLSDRERSATPDCSSVRPDLPEHALGTLLPERLREVEAHLAWCAGCRKEARELAEGAAALGLAIPAPEPAPTLEEKVTRAVRRRTRPRRPRVAAAAAAAALLAAAITGGWAVAMRQQVREFADAAASARLRAERFEQTVRQIVSEQGSGLILSAPLAAGRVAPRAGGRAIVFDSRADDDWVLVIVGGLPEDAGPYQGYVVRRGARHLIGRLWPSARGEMTAYKIFPQRDLAGSDRVVVLDSDGLIALRGTLGTET